MSFNLDELAEEIGANSSNYIEEMYDDADRIRDRMNSRRKLMERQVAADGIKSRLCDKIQQRKREVPGLAQKISALEDDDPELFKYIRQLEFINQGIWCPKCNVQKCVGTRPEPSAEAASSQNEIKIEYERISQKLQFAVDDMQALRNQFEDKLQQLAQAIVTLNDELNMVNREASSRGIDINQDLAPRISKESLRHVNESIKNFAQDANKNIRVPTINETVKKEDLPAMPKYDIDAIINAKYDELIKNNVASSDDLLY